MQKHYFLSFLVFFSFYCFAQKPFFPVLRLDKGNWDYLDSQEKLIFSLDTLLYASPQPFSEGRAAVKNKKTGRWGYLDEGGKLAIQPIYSEVMPFKGGMAVTERPCDAACNPGEAGLLFSNYTQIIDRNGKIVLNDNSQSQEPAERFQFDFYNDGTFFRTTVGLSVGDLKYLVNRKGERIGNRSGGIGFPQPQYSDDVIFTANRTEATYLDKNGKNIITIKQDNDDERADAFPFSGGYAWVRNEADAQLLNKKNKTVLRLDAKQYSSPQPVGEELFAAIAGNESVTFHYLNLKGEAVITKNFEQADPFSNGVAFVRTSAAAGYIDKKGEFVVKLSDFSTNLFEFGAMEKNGYAFIYKLNPEQSSFNPIKQTVGVVFKNGTIWWSIANINE